jgi:ATP-binding cassette subfamily F protein 3
LGARAPAPRRRGRRTGRRGRCDRSAPDRKAQKRSEAEARQRAAEARRPFEKRIAAIERELEPLQREKTSSTRGIASTEAYVEQNKPSLQERIRRQGEVATRIATLEEDWLWVSAELDAQRKAG